MPEIIPCPNRNFFFENQVERVSRRNICLPFRLGYHILFQNILVCQDTKFARCVLDVMILVLQYRKLVL